MSRVPLDSFWQKPLEDDFPVLNPSKATPLPSMPAMGAPRQQQPQAAPEQPKEQSFMGKMKDRAIGAAKSIGKQALDTGELVARGASATLPGVGMIPSSLRPNLTDIPGVQAGLDKGSQFLQPTNDVQAQAKSVTDWATLLTPFVGSAVAKAPRFARALEEVSLRLTASEKRDLGEKLDRATNFLVEKGITGNPSTRLDKAQMLYEKTEERLQEFLTKEAKNIKIPREIYVQRLESLKNKFSNSRDSLVISDQIDDAIKTFKSNYKNSPLVSVDKFNQWKRSVMSDAFNKAGLKVRDDVEFEIGKEATDMLTDGLKKLKIDGADFTQFNEEYADLINARKLLYKAEDRDEIAMIGKIITTMLGSSVGGGLGFAAGGLLGSSFGVPAGVYAASKIAPRIAGTTVRSNLGQVYNSVESLGPAAKKAAALVPLSLSQIAESLGLVKGGSDAAPDMQKSPKEPQEERKEGRRPIESFR